MSFHNDRDARFAQSLEFQEQLRANSAEIDVLIEKSRGLRKKIKDLAAANRKQRAEYKAAGAAWQEKQSAAEDRHNKIQRMVRDIRVTEEVAAKIIDEVTKCVSTN